MLTDNQRNFIFLSQEAWSKGLDYKCIKDDAPAWFTLIIEGVGEIPQIQFDFYEDNIDYTCENTTVSVDVKIAKMLINDHARKVRLVKSLLK